MDRHRPLAALAQGKFEYRLVALAAAIVFFTNLGGPLLWDEDEPKNAVCAREMFDRGDWIVPTFNQKLRTDKPILLYWLTLLSYHAFGVGEFGARFASASLSLGTVLLTAHLGRVLFTARTGAWAGIVLATCLTFAMSARAATPDATLIFFTTAALTIFATAWNRASQHPDSRLGTRPVVLMYAALGLAVLAKGPVGFLLPVAVIGSSVAISSLHRPLNPRQLVYGLVGTVHRIRLLSGAVIALAVAAPWYIAVGIETDWQWPLGFLEKHNVSRFLKPMEGHSGWIIYYFPAILLGMLPWSLPLIAALRESISRLRVRNAERWSDLFLWSWIGIYLVFFSLARTKLPTYVLPCYPALAVIIGRLIEGRFALPAPQGMRLWRDTYAGGVVLGVGLCAAGAVMGQMLLQGERRLVFLGVIPLIGSGAAWYFLRTGRVAASVRAFAAMAVLFHAFLLGCAADWVSRHQVGERFARAIRESGAHPAQIATLSYFRPSLAFYGSQPVDELHQVDDVVCRLRNNAGAFVVMREEKSAEILAQLPGDVVILDRSPAFLRPQKSVVLIGRRQISDVPDDAPGDPPEAPRTRGAINAN